MKRKLYMIGNAHLDPVWLWQWDEGFAENKATMLSMLQRLDEFDDVVFTSSSAQFYEWIEQQEPELFEKIRKRVKQGRWVICGGWWVQPDCNIPCGESFARHSLLGQKYFRDKFGSYCTVGYCVDSFGHNGMLPQVLKLSGMDSYVFMRPGAHEKAGVTDNLFRWRSADGSEITTYRIPLGYTFLSSPKNQMEGYWPAFSDRLGSEMCFYGVGNHGGGPTISNILQIQELDRQYPDTEFVFASPVQYFEDMLSKNLTLQVVDGELQHHSSGCYSVHSAIKSANRHAENNMLRAEKLSVMAGLLRGRQYPVAAFTQGWKNILFNQFHDILAGTSIEEAYQDAIDSYGESNSIAARAAVKATQAISFAVDIPHEEGTVPVLIFNPHSWQVQLPVEVEWGGCRNTLLPEEVVAVAQDGAVLQHQWIQAHVQCRDRRRLVLVPIVPAMGYTLVTLKPAKMSQQKAISPQCYLLENDNIAVKIDEASGAVTSLVNKHTGSELVDGEAALPVVMADLSDTWAHAVASFDCKEGVFVPYQVAVEEDGPLCRAVTVYYRYGDSLMQQTFSLYTHSDQLDVKVKINWREKRKCLKLTFPVFVADARSASEIPYGVALRSNTGEEEPMQGWVDIWGTAPSGDKQGLAVINDSKYGYDAKENVLNLTVLRCPAFANHRPVELVEPYERYSFIDNGVQEFRYSIVPHTGDWSGARLHRRAMELNQPCVKVVETFHKGCMPQQYSLLEIDAENVVVTCLKQAYEQDGLVLRMNETCGRTVTANVRFEPIGELKVDMKPWQIKTLLINTESRTATEVNLLEDKL